MVRISWLVLLLAILAAAPARLWAGGAAESQTMQDVQEQHERYRDFYDSDQPKPRCPSYPPITCTPPLDPLLAPCCPGMAAPAGQ